MNTIAIIGSCDTKYREIAYMREQVESQGMKAMVINVGPQAPIRLMDTMFPGKMSPKQQGQSGLSWNPGQRVKRLHL